MFLTDNMPIYAQLLLSFVAYSQGYRGADVACRCRLHFTLSRFICIEVAELGQKGLLQCKLWLCCISPGQAVFMVWFFPIFYTTVANEYFYTKM